MAKRGRPRKEAGPTIEYVSSKRPSAFDLKRFGIKPRPDKDYRWAAPNRVDEHKNLNKYSVYKAKEGETQNESGHVITKGGMVLMERHIDDAKESQARKIIRTQAQTKNVREMRRAEFERLSSKHGVDLHKHFLDKIEKYEDGG